MKDSGKSGKLREYQIQAAGKYEKYRKFLFWDFSIRKICDIIKWYCRKYIRLQKRQFRLLRAFRPEAGRKERNHS